MFLFTDKRGHVVGGFRHWSDAVEFESANHAHHYHRLDLPDLDEQLQALLGTLIEKAKPEHEGSGPCV